MLLPISQVAQTLLGWINSCDTHQQLATCREGVETRLQAYQPSQAATDYLEVLRLAISKKETQLQQVNEAYPNASLRIGFMRATL